MVQISEKVEEDEHQGSEYDLTGSPFTLSSLLLFQHLPTETRDMHLLRDVGMFS